jgi:hypothetical protein
LIEDEVKDRKKLMAKRDIFDKSFNPIPKFSFGF